MKIVKGDGFKRRPKKERKKFSATKESVKEKSTAVYSKALDKALEKVNKLEQSKRIGILPATTKRFFKISGADLAGLLTLSLFTTLIPIIVLGIGRLTLAKPHLTVGDRLAARLGIEGNLVTLMHDAFPSGNDLRPLYTFFGVAGYLVYGIPLAIQVGRIFAKAYDSRRFPYYREVIRGCAWFALFLTATTVGQVTSRHYLSISGLSSYVLYMVILFVFWTLTPAVLVRDGSAGIRYLMVVGVFGMIVQAIILPTVFAIILPLFLSSWENFGSLGVAIVITTWCGITSLSWVIIACFGGVLSDRRANNIPMSQALSMDSSDE